MRICFLTTPASSHSHRWVRYFADRGHEIHWISLGIPGEITEKNTTFHLINRSALRPLRPFFYAARVRKLLGRIQPDILHVHQAWIDGIIGAVSGYRPFVLTVWGSDVLISGGSKVKGQLVKFALMRANSISCDAIHVKQAMLDMGVPVERIKVINFGVEVDNYCPGPKSQALVDELRISGSPVVISLRNLTPLYDVESLVRAVPLVLREVPDTKFIVAGNGPEKENLGYLADSLGVASSIRFVGLLPSNLMPEYLRLADVYVSTALSDAGIAASTAEAMACEVAPVITDFGDNREWVEDNGNGFLVPLRSPKDIASRIVTLLRDEELRRRFGKVSRQVICERNDWETEMGKVQNLYEEIVGVADQAVTP